MIGSFLSNGLVMIFGYAYPAYECFKTVERNKPEVEQLRFWCQYWIVVAVLAVFERIGEVFISWVPMYSEAKLALYIYLWYPKTKGTSYVYDSFLKPYIQEHQADIDRNLMELRTRAGDMAVFYIQKATAYGQTRFFEIMQFVASQPFPRPYQNQVPKAAQKHRHVPATPQPQADDPPSPISSTSSSQNEEEVESPESKPTLKKKTHHSYPEIANNSKLKKSGTPESPESGGESGNEADPEQDKAKSTSPPQETAMEDTIRETRVRLRRSRSIKTDA